MCANNLPKVAESKPRPLSRESIALTIKTSTLGVIWFILYSIVGLLYSAKISLFALPIGCWYSTIIRDDLVMTHGT